MNILFLCVGNSARSQIAEGLAREMLGTQHNIKSAGSMPSGYIHEGALKTMNEIDIDISNQYSKSIDDIEEDFMKNLDYVITLCAEEICPILISNAKLINWANEDPAKNNFSIKQSEKMFRRTRENIYNLLKNFLILNT